MSVSQEVKQLTDNLYEEGQHSWATYDENLAALNAHTLLGLIATFSKDDTDYVLRRMTICMRPAQPDWKKPLASGILIAVKNFCQ